MPYLSEDLSIINPIKAKIKKIYAADISTIIAVKIILTIIMFTVIKS